MFEAHLNLAVLTTIYVCGVELFLTPRDRTLPPVVHGIVISRVAA